MLCNQFHLATDNFLKTLIFRILDYKRKAIEACILTGDTAEVNTGAGTAHFFCCKYFNVTVVFDDSNDTIYLYHLAEEQRLWFPKYIEMIVVHFLFLVLSIL